MYLTRIRKNVLDRLSCGSAHPKSFKLNWRGKETNFYDQTKSINAKTTMCLVCLADNLIIQKIEDTTKGSDILDLILTNRDKIVKGVEVVGTLEESEHIIQEFTIMQAQLTKQRQTSVLDFKRDYFNKLREWEGFHGWKP